MLLSRIGLNLILGSVEFGEVQGLATKLQYAIKLQYATYKLHMYGTYICAIPFLFHKMVMRHKATLNDMNINNR